MDDKNELLESILKNVEDNMAESKRIMEKGENHHEEVKEQHQNAQEELEETREEVLGKTDKSLETEKKEDIGDDLIKMFQKGNETLKKLEEELERKQVAPTPLDKKTIQEIVEHIYAGDLKEYLDTRVKEEKKKEFGTLEDLAKIVYSSVDREYKAPSITSLDSLVKEDDTLISKIQVREDNNKKTVWIKPFLKSWVRKEDIETIDPSLRDLVAKTNDESFGNYISLNDLELSLSEFYRKNKKEVFTVQTEDGKFVKYKISKNRLKSLTDFLQNYSYLNLTKAPNSEDEDIRQLKSYNPETEKKASLGNMNLGQQFDMNKDFMTPGKYVSIDSVIKELPNIFKKQHNWEELKKEDTMDFGKEEYDDLLPPERGRGK